MPRLFTIRKLIKASGAVLLFSAVFTSNLFAADHDGDGKADLTVFRQGNGTWFVASTGLDRTLEYQWGLPGDIPVQGKYTGGAGTDLAVWRPIDATWYIRNYSTDLKFSTTKNYQWGVAALGDKPYPCDFDGDGNNELAVYRQSDGFWYLRNSIGNVEPYDNFTFQPWGGLAQDVAAPADYDMDGKCDYTIYRGGDWFIILSSTNGSQSAVLSWGTPGDIPVSGQYTADNIRDFAVYRARSKADGGSLWVIRESTLAGLTFRAIAWGQEGDQPVPADYTGDGKTDIAVYRGVDENQVQGVWYILTSESNYTTSMAIQFGLNGDIAHGDNRGGDPA